MTSTAGRGKPTKVPAAVARAAAAFGPRPFFGLSGSGNFHLTHELRDAGFDYYAAAHEAGCVAMADGYARTAGKAGIATVHQGPGLTNAVTALREAVRSHTPMVVFAADLPAGSDAHNQYVDQAALARSVGAAVEVLRGVDTVVADVVRCFRRAELEQRPVVMTMPIDLQEQVCAGEPDAVDPRSLRTPQPPQPAMSDIDQATDLLRSARHPVLLAGRGAASGAGPEIAALAELLSAPLLTSARARGLFRGHLLDVGLAGGFGTPRARRVLAEADAVAVFGCSLNPWTLAENEDLADHAELVQVDVDPAALSMRLPVRLPILADCGATARALRLRLEVEQSPGGGPIPTPPRRHEPPEPRPAAGTRPGTIDPFTLTRLLDELLPEERTVSIDSGHFMVFPASMMEAPDPQGFLLAQGFMSMGLALAEGLGAAAARPERLVVVAVGDGGAKMSITELDTAVRHGIPVLTVIYNDAAFGAEVHDFEDAGRSLDTVRFADVDFAAVARGLGADGITVRDPHDLAAVGDWLTSRSRPLVVDAKVDPEVRGPWVD